MHPSLRCPRKELLKLSLMGFIFTMWTLDSGCENAFSLGGDKGERAAGFSGDTRGSFAELPARTPAWP